MTRKDYELIARTIREGMPNEHPACERTASVRSALEQLSKRFGWKLERDNPRFDRGRFLEACGVPE